MIRVRSATGHEAKVSTPVLPGGRLVSVQDPAGQTWYFRSEYSAPHWTSDPAAALMLPDGAATLAAFSIAAQLDGAAWDETTFGQLEEARS